MVARACGKNNGKRGGQSSRGARPQRGLNWIALPSGLSTGWVPDVPRCSYCENALIAAREKHPLEEPAALIVQEVFVPAVLYQFRYHHNNGALGMLLRKIENELNDGNDDEPVGRRQK